MYSDLIEFKVLNVLFFNYSFQNSYFCERNKELCLI